jgi:hypothetical protein
VKKSAAILALMVFAFPASAAGIDSRAYTCTGLHSLVAANRFVFIGNPSFQDFVVANASFCGGGQRIELRSVQTSDNPECPVNYCTSIPDNER